MAKTYQLENLEITWLGHASFKIKNGNQIIYLDPFNISFGEKADLILCTHDHFDHKDERSIQILAKTETEILIGGENIREGEEKEINGVKIKAVPAYNLTKPFHPRGKAVGFILEIEGQRIYHAGDTDKIPEMTELGKIDLALLPIGGTYTMNENEAAEAVKMIQPKKVMPMHYGSLSETPGNPEKFKELVGDLSEVIILN
ncbi:MAG: MBL fold metallo-hydrolase [Patescibacteria group bacterium]|nr:MBL fold metallo-hydrolase [Patescibacteria group bacterium]